MIYLTTGWLMRHCGIFSDPVKFSVSLDEALDELRDEIRVRGQTSAYPFDVFGRRILAWCQSATLTASGRNDLLVEAERLVEHGAGLHPRVEWLRELYREIQRTRLMAVVTRSNE